MVIQLQGQSVLSDVLYIPCILNNKKRERLWENKGVGVGVLRLKYKHQRATSSCWKLLNSVNVDERLKEYWNNFKYTVYFYIILCLTC